MDIDIPSKWGNEGYFRHRRKKGGWLSKISMCMDEENPSHHFLAFTPHSVLSFKEEEGLPVSLFL